MNSLAHAQIRDDIPTPNHSPAMWRAGRQLTCIAALPVMLAVMVSPSAAADVVDMAAQQYTKATRDGYTLNISIENEKVNSVPNLAGAVNSREAFVTLSATATATGGSSPITDSVFITGYQLGCHSDVSSGLSLGGAGAVGPSISPTSVTVGGGLTGYLQTTIQPGVITELPMANMALSDGGTAMLDIDNIHIKADACGGDVTIRSYAYLRTSTAQAHSEFAIYGDPIKI